MHIVLLGPPGAGKGTQAQMLSMAFDLLHVATGDLFREAARLGTPLGLQVQAYMERGELVPDEVTIGVLLERLKQSDAANGALLDGFPRTVAQAEALDRALAAHDQHVQLAVYLKVPQIMLLARLSGRWFCSYCGSSFHSLYRPSKEEGICDRCGHALHQRPDDRPETALHRLEVYERLTVPVLEYYRQQGILKTVNGDQSVEEVQRDIAEAIGNREGSVSSESSARASD